MIIVKLMGGLGNQMFQYATAKRLADKIQTTLLLDVSTYDNMASIDTPRHYELSCYKISAKTANEHDLGRMLPQGYHAGLFYKITRRLGIDKRLRPLGEPNKSFYDIMLRARDNTYIVGWWQNERYFKDVRKILLEEFEPKEISSYSKQLLKMVKASSSVSIHVRRGDYATNKNANKEHGLLPISYYERSIKFLRDRQAELRFFVFSDDIDWCKNNLRLGNRPVFVEGNVTDKSHEDIYLMQHCKHNIIANSSFSWWGAWLNDNPGKIVIAPKNWFRNKASNSETEIVPRRWIRL